MTEPADVDNAKYGGMTINERLLVTGLSEQFDRAARSRDRALMIELLNRVLVTTPEWTADAILAAPDRYGYGLDGA
jgi:hypothetical protein